MSEERLQKLLSQWGLASRRQAERLITEGQVRVNGAIATLGQKANPEIDTIEVSGKLLNSERRPQLRYLLLNKPLGVISTCSDPQNRSTVLDLLSPDLKSVGLHPVGRLDAFTTGALLLTNDGPLTHRLTHPSHNTTKTYQVEVKGKPSVHDLNHWRQGILLDGRMTRPAKVRLLHQGTDSAHLEIVLQEGRNRQIRRIAKQLGYPVLRLHRTAVGPLKLSGLKPGDYRHLSPKEISLLHQETSPDVPLNSSHSIARCG